MNNARNAQIVAWFSSLVLSAILFFGAYKILSSSSDLEDIPSSAHGGHAANTSHEKHEGPKHAATTESHHSESTHEEKPSEKHAAWNYEEGKIGPAHWADISKDYHSCADGHLQSPINITGAKVNTHLPHIKFLYNPSTLEVINNGHTIQANVASGNYIDLGGDRYELKEFHFHNPSEHKIDGIPGAMEVHYVHKNSQGKIAMVGVVVEESKENKAFANMWQHLPAKENSKVAVEHFNLTSTLPIRKEYYTYSGSLTTPPCSEGVKWIVMREGITLSGSQVDAFAAIVKRSARPTQELHSRAVEVSGDGGDMASH